MVVAKGNNGTMNNGIGNYEIFIYIYFSLDILHNYSDKEGLFLFQVLDILRRFQ